MPDTPRKKRRNTIYDFTSLKLRPKDNIKIINMQQQRKNVNKKLSSGNEKRIQGVEVVGVGQSLDGEDGDNGGYDVNVDVCDDDDDDTDDDPTLDVDEEYDLEEGEIIVDEEDNNHDEDGGDDNDKLEEEEEEEGELREDVEEQYHIGRGMKRKEPITEVPNRRRRKRMKIQEIEAFFACDTDITTITSTTTAQSNEKGLHQEERQTPPPSSDLLKSIHRLSADLYTTRGVLYHPDKHKNERERKQKGKSQQQPQHSPSNSSKFSSDKTHDWVQDHNQDDSGVEDNNDDSLFNEYINFPETQTSTSTIPIPSTRSLLTRKDRNMYRVFDGSLLLGLGVLVQEKVAQSTEPKSPQEVVQQTDEDNDKLYPQPYPIRGCKGSFIYGGETEEEEKKWRIEIDVVGADDEGNDLGVGGSGTDHEAVYDVGSKGEPEYCSKFEMDEWKPSFEEVNEETDSISLFIPDEDEEVDQLDSDQY